MMLDVFTRVAQCELSFPKSWPAPSSFASQQRLQPSTQARSWWLTIFFVIALTTWVSTVSAQEIEQSAGPHAAYQQAASGADASETSTAVEPVQNTDATVDQAPNGESAGIIAILKEAPEALAAVKNEFARQTSTDPSAISDEMVFSRISQDPELRARAVQELTKRGYMVGDDSGNAAKTPSKPRAKIKPETRPRTEEPPEEPLLRERPIPYPGLPSFKELYSQLAPDRGKLKRFGSDTFRIGTGNADGLPMDLPVGPDYVLGPGDELIINLWGSISLRLNRTIDRQGQVALPEGGPIIIAGSTIAQAQELIRKALSPGQFKELHAEISLGRLRTVRIYVVGDVQRPGAYDISALSTPLNALYAAGGPTSRGSLRTLRHYRNSRLLREIDLYDFLLHGASFDIDRLLPGDTVLVPPAGPQVAVSGMVRRPAIYELKSPIGLDEVLDLAGGVLVSATLQQITVERIEAHQRRTMVSVQLGEPVPSVEPLPTNQNSPNVTSELDLAAAPAAAGKNSSAALKPAISNQGSDNRRQSADDHESPHAVLASFRVQDGDRVLVAPILPYNEKAIYLEGHVYRPGRVAYREGMTINDLLRSYQDVMPEPADHAELVRLEPPDLRPLTISFNLTDVLAGNDPIVLQPFDMIRIFSRYEIDPPKVTITGEVLRPGEYRLEQGMTAADLVRMAGEFKRSAYREEADLTSYVVQNDRKILLKHSVVQIGRAVDGDKTADVKLKPGDVLGIRQLSGWKDIGGAVTVRGEIVYPGTYGIEHGERLSSVLKRAGGFTDTAYAAGAVLEGVEVREIAEKARQEMIRRLETTPPNVHSGLTNSQEDQATLQSMRQQQQEVLAALRAHAASGRQVISISGDISKWENTPADIEMRAGDVLTIPKLPTFVTVSGQVYNASAITFKPGKTAEWYLRAAGGPTQTANRKAIYVVRVDGSVIGQARGGFWKESVLNARLQPGDSIVVPEKIIGGSQFWKNMVSMGQIMSSMGLTAAVAVK